MFSNKIKGYLTLPTTLGTSSCNDYNAAGKFPSHDSFLICWKSYPVTTYYIFFSGYFQNDDTECARSFSDLSLECSNLSALSAPRYYSYFQVAMVIEINSCSLPMFFASLFLQVENLILTKTFSMRRPATVLK